MATQVKVICYGGPLDGEVQYRPVIDEPAKFPLLLHKGTNGRRYVYQARKFLGDEEIEGGKRWDPDTEPMPFDFVQILRRGEDL